MAKALYNRLNKYNLGGLVKRYEHGGAYHDAEGNPTDASGERIYGGDTKEDAPGNTGTNIYTTERNNPYAAAEGENEASKATLKELQNALKKIWRDKDSPVMQAIDKAREDGTISGLEYQKLSAKNPGFARNHPLKTMSRLSELGVINLEDYPSFSKRLNFLTAGWGDQTRADFVKGLTSEVVDETELGTTGKQISEDSFVQTMYKGGDPSRGFKRSLTNNDGELEKKTRDTPLTGGLVTRGRQVDSNKVRFEPSDSYIYTEGEKEVIPEEEEVIKLEEEKIPVVEEEIIPVDDEIIPTKELRKPEVIKEKDIIPGPPPPPAEKEKTEEEEEVELLEVDDKPDLGYYDVSGDVKPLHTDYTGGSSTLATGPYSQHQRAVEQQINNPYTTFKPLKTGGKLYKRGGLAMLAKRAAMGKKYNTGGRPSGNRMTNQELASLLAKYRVK
jgi:hypothetical protein